jgi:tetratricopeptide (TPR) repeat protein
VGKKSRKKTLRTPDKKPAVRPQASKPEISLNNNGGMLLSFLLLAVLIFGVYASSINNEFVWDDAQIIKENPDIRSLSNTGKLLLSEDTFPDIRSYYYRPVTYLSFMMDYVLWKGSPKGFHTVNILLHLLFCCLLYVFVRDIPGSSGAALAASVIFGLHPAATETVNFISGGRNTLLCGVFLLAALVSHRKNRLILTLIFLTLSVFSKEFGLLFPVLAALTDSMFPRAGHDRTKDLRTYSLYGAVIIFYLVMRTYVVGGSGLHLKLEKLPERLLLIPQIIVTYLKVMVIPYKLTVPYYIKMPGAINGAVVMYTVVLILVISCIYYFRKRNEVSFSALWFFIALLPVLNIIPLGDIFVAERYVYIALAGFAILLGAISTRFHKRYSIPALVLISVLFSIVVINRNQVWKNDFSLFTDAAQKSPDSPYVHNILGVLYLDRGRTNDAMNEFQLSIKLKPDYYKSHNNLGNVYKAQNRFDDAIKEYLTSLKLNPDYSDAHYNLGISYKAEGRTDDAIKEYQIALKLRPGHPFAHNNLGNVYREQGRIDDAIKEYQIALKLNPADDNAHTNMGNAYKVQGKIDQAIEEYQIALRLNPGHTIAHNNLGVTYFDQGRTGEAIREYQAAIKLKPDYANAHSNLGNAYKAQGRTNEATKEYQIAQKLRQR